MENEKKYVGNGKKQGFGVKVNLNFNKVMEHLYKDTNNKTVASALKNLIEAVEKETPPYMSIFKPEGGKKTLTLKIEVSERKEADKFGNTHNIVLNEFVPQKIESVKAEPINDAGNDNDDLPF